jgi:hypothetical protein
MGLRPTKCYEDTVKSVSRRKRLLHLRPNVGQALPPANSDVFYGV